MSYTQQGEGGQQSGLCMLLEGRVPEDHLARMTEASVIKLDLQALGFRKARLSRTGASASVPPDLLRHSL